MHWGIWNKGVRRNDENKNACRYLDLELHMCLTIPVDMYSKYVQAIFIDMA